jgi:hypothetical protein
VALQAELQVVAVLLKAVTVVALEEVAVDILLVEPVAQ